MNAVLLRSLLVADPDRLVYLRTSSPPRGTGRIIVALQMALCVVLLVAAGLLIRTLHNLENTPLGMRVDGLVVFGVKPNVSSVPQGIAFYRNLMSKLRVLPGVESVTLMESRMGSGGSNNSDMRVDRRIPDVANGASKTVRWNVVGPDFFTTLGVPVLDATLPIPIPQNRNPWELSTKNLPNGFCRMRILWATPLDPRGARPR